MELPERFDTRMNALRALEQFQSDARVIDPALLENGARHRDRSLRVVGGLADSPLAPRIPDVPRDGCSCRPFETSDPVRIPSENAVTRQRLCLLADRVTGRDPLQAGENPVIHLSFHVFATSCLRVFVVAFQIRVSA